VSETLRQQAEDIRQWNEALPGPVDLRLVKTGDERTAPLESFLDGLASLAPQVRTVWESGREGDLPAILIGRSWTFHLVPEGKELSPFLGLLTRIASGRSGLPAEVSASLQRVQVPSVMEIFVTTVCPNCPAVVSRLAPFPLANPRIRVQVVDGLLFSERSRERGIRAVPSVLLPGGVRFTGQVLAREAAEALLQGDPSRMGTEALARMIQAGDAEGLARMMLERRQVFPGVVDLLAGEMFSLRLGAMVALETLAEEAPELARDALESLWGRMEEAHPSARGDMVYLIGEFGDAAWIPRLESLLESSPPEEFREAVEEALETLKA
jgi:alkyl hydroperoxide reductase subunit AhpF